MEKTSSKVALMTALVLLTGAVIIEGILIFWMQQEINYIKTTITREDTVTVVNTDKSNVEFERYTLYTLSASFNQYCTINIYILKCISEVIQDSVQDEYLQ